MKAHNFVLFEDVERIGRKLAAEARRCGDERGADGIELLVDEVRSEIQATLYDLSTAEVRDTLNGGRS